MACFLVMATLATRTGVRAEVIVADDANEAVGKFILEAPAAPVDTTDISVSWLHHVVAAGPV
jgi:hypothetical protein